MVLSIFSCIIGYLYSLVREMSILVLCPFLKNCLFIFYCSGSSLLCGDLLWLVARRGSSSCGMQASRGGPSLAAERRL